MSLRALLLGATALSLAAVAAPAPPARAQAVGGIGGAPLTLQQAQRKFPGLRPVTFGKADLNDDGVIEPNELPVLQSVYTLTTGSR